MTVDRATPAQSGLVLWMGSVLQEGRDQSALQYKRNRYYDPAVGRFTQSDPIGLAGGLNAYGFASGDPVNFSDPFGLCPPQDNDCADIDMLYGVTGATVGMYTGGPPMATSEVLASGASALMSSSTAMWRPVVMGVATTAAAELSVLSMKTAGLEKQLAKHLEKLEQYRKDPFAFDNKGFLRDAPTPEIRDKIIRTRIANLEQQIETFRQAIKDLLK